MLPGNNPMVGRAVLTRTKSLSVFHREGYRESLKDRAAQVERLVLQTQTILSVKTAKRQSHNYSIRL